MRSGIFPGTKKTVLYIYPISFTLKSKKLGLSLNHLLIFISKWFRILKIIKIFSQLSPGEFYERGDM